MPRCRNLAIFVVTTDGQIDRQTDTQTDYFTPAHVRGVIIRYSTSDDDQINLLITIVQDAIDNLRCEH